MLKIVEKKRRIVLIINTGPVNIQYSINDKYTEDTTQPNESSMLYHKALLRWEDNS